MTDMQAHREEVYNQLGLNEFQRIAMDEIVRKLDELGEVDYQNVTPEQEELLMSLGTIGMESPLLWEFLSGA